MMKGRQLIGPILTGVILVTLYCPVLIWLIGVWLDSPYYSYGFLILPVSAFITWTRRKELIITKPLSAGAAVFAIGLVAYVLGFIWKIYWLWAFSSLIVTLGLLLYFRGAKAARSMLFPICFLIFMIPLPFLDSIAIPLQSITTYCSASIATAVGIPVTRTGAEIRLADSAFIIGLPCSGMNILTSLLALAAVFVYFLKGSYYKRGSLFVLVFPIAILANIMRIVLLLVIAHFWGTEAALTFFHGFSSLLIFLIAFLCLFLLSRFFGCGFGGMKKN